ncbi:hypothetical protein Dimus_023333 [Dionaea muscipula]
MSGVGGGGGGGGKLVCVTGASGFIASWLVKLLLLRGYTVRATVRDPDDKKRTEHLLSLDGAKERLQLFKSDLLDPQAELIDPAVKGTLNVLKSCAKAASIRRVVVTSSMATVIFNEKPLSADTVVDESWFSSADFCEKSKLWYMLSKTLAEDAAWKFAKQMAIDLVTINPGYVIGPPLQPTINLTVKAILNLVNAISFPNVSYRWVDVRDVANAHILAFEVPAASGRYCVVGKVAHLSETINILHQLFPQIPFPEKVVTTERKREKHVATACGGCQGPNAASLGSR